MGSLLLACLLAGNLLAQTVQGESDWRNTDTLMDSLAMDSHKEDSLAMDSHKDSHKEDSLAMASHKEDSLASHKDDSLALASQRQARGVARQGGGLLGDVYNYLANPELNQRRQVGAVTGVSMWRREMMMMMMMMMMMILTKIFILVIRRRRIMKINDVDDDYDNGLCLFLLRHIPLLESFCSWGEKFAQR